MSIISLLEITNNKLSSSAYNLASAISELKKKSGTANSIAVILEATEQILEETKKLGFDKIIHVKNDQLRDFSSSLYADVLYQLSVRENAKFVGMAATVYGKDILPRVSSSLNAGLISDVSGINDDQTFQKLVFAGNLISTVKIKSDVKLVSFRTSSFPKYSGTTITESIEEYLYSSTIAPEKFIQFDEVKSERPDLNSAEIVVSGGKALGSKEKFDEFILPLAEALNAAVGASRVAVDSGYAPNDWQVGQTGKVVAPKLYIACGISGAIQHIAGMKDSKVIVAINKDPEAPIFDISDYGLVGDIFEIIPELIKQIKN